MDRLFLVQNTFILKIIPFTIPVSGEQSIIVQEDREPHFYPYLHQHPEVQVTWVQRGTGNLLVGEQVHRFQAHDVFVIGANQPHLFNSDPAYFEPGSTLSIQALTLFFDPQKMGQLLKNLPELAEMPTVLQSFERGMKLGASAQHQVIDLLQHIQTSSKIKRLALFLDMIDVLQQDKLALSLSQENTLIISETEGQRISSVFQYVLQHYAEDIALEQVASLIHFSPPAFCRYFKKHTRKTFTQFLNEIRIHAACRILREEWRKTIADVAFTMGFNNIPHFNRTFKQVTGQRPTDWRKKQRG